MRSPRHYLPIRSMKITFFPHEPVKYVLCVLHGRVHPNASFVPFPAVISLLWFLTRVSDVMEMSTSDKYITRLFQYCLCFRIMSCNRDKYSIYDIQRRITYNVMIAVCTELLLLRSRYCQLVYTLAYSGWGI